MNLMHGTTMSSWDPFRDLDDFSRRLGGFFGRAPAKVGSDAACAAAARWVPAVDIVESKDAYSIAVELPGVEREQVKVSVEEGSLIIEGERRFASEEKDAKVHRVERVYGSFRRVFRMPEDAEASKVLAEFRAGVLQVHLPKRPESQPRQIEVKVN